MRILRFFALAIQVRRTKLSDVTHRRYRKRYKTMSASIFFSSLKLIWKEPEKWYD